jgi:ribokinase
MEQRPRVTVLGSMNMDISVTVPRLAGPGETVLGSAARLLPGGKGGNCALAAARLGAAVRMTGCCGDDDFGAALTSALRTGGVDVTGVRAVAGASSGIALITVDAAGENSITVAPGANGRAGEPEVAAAFTAPADVLVLSAEIPVPVLAAALDRARAARVTSVLNLAPVPAGARPLVGSGVDWLVVNAPEAGLILGRPVADPAAARSAAAELARAGARQVAVTLGPAGAVYGTPDGTGAVPGFRVPSVDSVGAGDAFVAALAVAVAAGTPPPEAVRLACAVGATAVTRSGAQEALPTGADVLAATGVRWPLG